MKNNLYLSKAAASFSRLFVCLLVVSGLWITNSSAQSANNYLFSTATGSGPLTITSPTTLVGPDQDDGVSGVVGIGFNFSFEGVSYSQFSVNTNGLLKLGPVATTNNWTNSATEATNFPKLFAIWDDLYSGTSATGGGVFYQLQGSGSTQRLVVEYHLVHNESDAAVDIICQTILYQTTNVIEFRYGTGVGGFVSASIGIGGATPANYLEVNPSTHVSVAPPSTSDANTVWPGSGRMYTFTPPPPCSAPVDQASAFTPGSISFGSASFTFTAAASTPTGYLVVRYPSGNSTTPPVNNTTYVVGGSLGTGTIVASGASTSITATGLAASNTYDFYIYDFNNTSCFPGPVYNTSSPLTGTISTPAGTLSGTKTVGTGGDYDNLTIAFAAINANGLIGDIDLQMITGYPATPETYPILSSNTAAGGGFNINVYPTVSGLSITSANATGTLDLNNGAKINFDGRVNHTGVLNLIIANTNAASGAYAVRFTNDATNNTLRFCQISSRNTSATSGTIAMTTGISTGNDGNTIDNCIVIDDASGSFPVNGIYSAGTSAAIDNSGNTVSNSFIANYFSATLLSSGILLTSTGNSAWTITGNRLYQTATRTYTTANTHNGISVQSGSGYTINNNILGFANATGTGTTNIVGNSVALTGFPASYSPTGTQNATRYIAINCAFTAGGTVSNIQGNTISGFALYTSSGAATTNGILCGINVTSGNANIGTSAGNTIGSTSGQGSLYTACSTTGGTVVGINTSSVNAVAIQNNTIGAFDASGTTATLTGGIIGIGAAGTGNVSINNNIIGNSTADNMRSGYLTTTGVAGGPLTNAGILTSSTGATSAIVGISNTSSGLICNITNNTLRGFATSGTVTAVTGITSVGSNSTAAGSYVIDNNFIGTAGLGWIRYAVTNTGTITGINKSGTTSGANSTVSVSGNDFRGIVYAAAAGAQTQSYLIYSASTGTSGTTNVNNNTFTNLSVNSTSGVTFMSKSGSLSSTGVENANGNSIVTAFSKTGSGGTVTCFTASGSSVNGSVIHYNNNNFSNITVQGATGITGLTTSDGSTSTSGPTRSINSNTFNSWTINTTPTGAITGISANFSGPGSVITLNTISNLTAGGAVTALTVGSSNQSITVSNNLIDPITSAGAAAVTAISTAAPTVSILANKIYDIGGTNAATTVNGILITNTTANSNVTVANNLIGNLTAIAANGTDMIRGISSTASATATTSTLKVYYNTIYIAASSSGVNFGTTGIFHTVNTTATTAKLDLRNNIVVNNSIPSGTGATVALRRNLGTAGSLANYASTSDNNLLWAGTPGASNLIYSDGTSSAQTLAAYQAGVFTAGTVAPRDGNSVTENSPFASTTGSNATFLHFALNASTLAESGGLPVAGVTTDFDGQTRSATTPDIGADEFTGISPAPFITNVTVPTGGNCTPINHTIDADITTPSPSTFTSITLNYNNGAPGSVTMVNVGGDTYEATIPASSPATATVTWSITATNSGGYSKSFVGASYNESTPLQINDVILTPSTPSFCSSGGTTTLTAFSNDAGYTYSWSVIAGSATFSNQTATTIDATLSQTSDFRVVAVNGSCADTAYVSIGAYPFPTATATAASNAVCIGDSIDVSSGLSASNFAVACIPYASIEDTSTAFSLCANGVAFAPPGGTAAASLDDGIWNNVPLGFTFNYFGHNYSTINVGTNGVIGFGLSSTQYQFVGGFPNVGNPRNTIAVAAADLLLTTAGGGTIKYWTRGIAPNRVFIVRYKDAQGYNGGGLHGYVTAECMLFETTGIVEIHILNFNTNTSIGGLPKLIGLQDTTATIGATAPKCSSPFTANYWNETSDSIKPNAPLAWRFTPPHPYSVTWAPSSQISGPFSGNNLFTIKARPTAIGAVTYSITFTDLVTGCNNNASPSQFTLNAYPQPVASVISLDTIFTCGPQTVNLSIANAGSLAASDTAKWYLALNGSPVHVGNTYSVFNNATTKYYVRTTNGTCSSTADSIVVQFRTAPSIVASNDGPICPAACANLNVTSSDANYVYTWNPGNLTGAMQNVCPGTATTYTVVAHDLTSGSPDSSCTTFDSTRVTFRTPPSLNAVTATPQAVCAGGSTVLSAVNTASSYCIPSVVDCSTYASFGNYLSQVSLNGTPNMVNNTGHTAASTQCYSDYSPGISGTTTTTLTAGNLYNVGFQQAQSDANIVSAWIDYNHDGVYSASEQIANGVSLGTSLNTTFSSAFTVPLTVLNGVTKMRVILNFSSNPTDPCGISPAYTWADVEDYNITIAGGVDYTYTWDAEPTLNSTTGATVTASNINGNHTYTVHVSDGVCTSTGSVTVTQSPLASAPTATLNPPYGPSAATSTADDEIYNVSFGSLNNTSTCSDLAPGPGSIQNRYSNYKSGTGAPAAPTITAGAVTPLSITIGYCNGSAFTTSASVYIDYNHNGIFTDPGENVGNTGSFVGVVTGTIASGSVTVPLTAINGLTVMRVIDIEGGATPVPSTGTYTWGETEDYYINIVGGATTDPCPNSAFVLAANASGGGTPYTYEWTSSPAGFTSTVANPSVITAATTTYFVKVKDFCGDSTMQSTTITIASNPLAVTPAVTTVCGTPHTVALTASGGTTYTWAPGATLDTTGGATVNATPTDTTIYTVTSVVSGCSFTATGTINVNAAPAVTITNSNPVLCGTGTITSNLHAGSVNDPNYNYTWTSSKVSTLNTTSGADVVATTDSTETYTVTAVSNDAQACIVTATTSVSVFSFTPFNAFSNRDTVCFGDTTQIHAGASAGTFSVAPIPYAGASLNAPTVLCTGGAAVVPQSISSLDDGGWFNLPIGFSFNYFGVTNTVFHLSTNGNIQFGSTGNFTTTFTPGSLPSTALPNNFVAGVWCDLLMTVSGTIQYQTIGNAPSRICVIQFLSCPFFGGTTGSNSCTFEIRLYETTGIVEVRTLESDGFASTGGGIKTTGVENIDGTQGSAAPGRNGVLWQFTSATPEAWRFTPPVSYSFSWSSNPAGFTSSTADTTVHPVGTVTYYVLVTDNNTLCTKTDSVTVTGLPQITPPVTVGDSVCGSGVVDLSASGNPTLNWYSAAVNGTLVNTGTTYSPSLSATTTFYVESNNGRCGSTRTPVVGAVNPFPSTNVTADATTGCIPLNTTLHAGAAIPADQHYTITSIPYNPVLPTGPVTVLAHNGIIDVPLSVSTTLDDGGWNDNPIPFNFTLYGTVYNAFGVSCNGFITLGSGTPNTYTGYGNTFPSTFAGHPSIGAAYGDLDFRTSDSASWAIAYYTEGTAPNRELVISWLNGRFYLGVAGSNISTQIILHEGSSQIEIQTQLVAHATATNSTVEGIQNAAGTFADVVPGRNGGAWNVTTSEGYMLVPAANSFTYSWSPTSFLNDPTASDPNVVGLTHDTVYTVTVTTSSGCSTQGSVAIDVSNCTDSLNMTMFIEGYYQSPFTATPMDGQGAGGALFTEGISLDPNEVDTVTVTLIDSTILANTFDYDMAAAAVLKGVVHTDGSLKVLVPGSLTGNSYYLKLVQRGSIETWSALPVVIVPVTSYNFSSNYTQAFDDFVNSGFYGMKQMGDGNWAFYSGDIDADHDGGVNIFDIPELSNELNDPFPFGYLVGDLDGDGGATIFDIPYLSNNINAGIFSQHP